MTEQKVRKQLVIPIKIERRHFEVYGYRLSEQMMNGKESYLFFMI